MCKFRFLNLFLRVTVAASLAIGIVAAGSAHPRPAEANPAVAVPVAVGTVVATGLACYGIYSVGNGRSVEDVGNEFMTWVNTSESVQSFLQARDWTRDYLFQQFYSIYNTGSLMFSEFFGLNRGQIARAWLAELLTLFAAENFGSAVSSSSVSLGSLSFNTFDSDIPSHGFGIGTSATSGIGAYPIYGYFVSSDSVVYVGNLYSSGLTPVLMFDDYGGWAVSYASSGGNAYIISAFTVAGSDASSAALNSVNYPDVSPSDIFLNSYYNLAVIHTTWNIASVVTSNNSNARESYASASAIWNASSSSWSGDVSVSLPDNLDYGVWSDAASRLGHSAADVLGKYLPVGSDLVYSPTAENVIENAGSVPLIQDWSNVNDWSDVLSGERSGLLDPALNADQTLDVSRTRVETINLASDTFVDVAIDDVMRIPWLPFSPDGSIPAALDFAGGQMLDRFPFCTIKDLQLLVDFMNTPSTAPYFDLPLVVVSGGSLQVVTQRISLEPWEPVAVVLRFMIGLLIILGFLRVATRQLKIFNEE